MKVILATPLYPPEIGGPATSAKILAEELPKHGIDVELVKFSDVRHLPPAIRHIAYAWRVYTKARTADVLFALDAVSVGWPAYFANLFLQKKLVVKMVGDHVWEQGKQRFNIAAHLDDMPNFSGRWHPYLSFLRILQRIVMQGTRQIIVPSEYLKKVVTAWGIAPEKVDVIYNGVRLPQPIAPAARPQGFLVVSAGRRVPWKGFEALERVVRRRSDWHLFIAADLPRAEALGWVQSADVFVLNSRYEGLSHVLIEALTLGTPVIATDVGGNPELIKDGETGLLVSPDDDDALFATLSRVHDDPEGARTRAAAARVSVASLTDEAMVQKTVDFLQRL